MNRRNGKFGVTLILLFAFLSTAQSEASLLQNMTFDTDITGWKIGEHDPLGTWSAGWSPQYGGSATMTVIGAPAQTSISQNTKTAMRSGDQITINMHHSYLGNFSGWFLLINHSVVLRGTQMNEGDESATWIVDRDYDVDTFLGIGASVWPGGAIYWVDSIQYTSILGPEPSAPVPEPTTMILLGSGLVGLAWFRKRRTKC